ncbi:Sodium-coupled monocarboxylate transporter 1 [Chionoecetes opilio]|uniref:Sodium-coupled monocarboxylate transporter 1 n=1 Tax=Chionoecetes opilio TaxID=41210 RepID=A0A8J5CL04_CHIOP|nr:Sodium-coupled monocarboxylate transporter 1 [Chionoecetes opilio]
MDWVLDKVVDQSDCGASVGNTKITDLVFADDAVIFAESLEVLVMALEALHEEAKPLGLEVSWLKTLVQVFGDLLDEAVQSVHACGEDIEILESFTYLGSAVHNDGGSRQEVLRRIGIAHGVMDSLSGSIWRCRYLCRRTKIRIFKSLVIPVLLYGCETWTLNSDLKRRINAFAVTEMATVAAISLEESLMEDLDAYKFKTADWVVFVLMLVVSVLIGVVSALRDRKKATIQDYLIGGGNMPPLAVALSLMGGWISAISILGNPTEIYFYGTQLSIALIGCIPGAIVVNKLMLPIFYNLKIVSLSEYLELRYHSTVLRKVGSFVSLLNLFLRMGMCLYAPSLALSTVTSLSTFASMAIMGAIVTFYTTIGGVKAVVYTDVLQTLLMFGGVLAVVVMCCIELGGIGKVWAIAERGDRLEFFNMNPSIYERHTFLSTLCMGFAFIINTLGISQSSYQRFASVSTFKTATGCIDSFISSWLDCGVCGSYSSSLVWSPTPPTARAILSPQARSKNPGQILPFLVKIARSHPRPVWPLCGGGVWRVLSTLSSCGNSAACMVWEDFLKPLPFFSKLSDKSATLVVKILSSFTGVLSVVLGLVMGSLGNIFHVLFSLPQLPKRDRFSGLFLTGILLPWVNAKGAFIGFLAALTFNVWMVVGNFVTGGGSPARLPLSVAGCASPRTQHWTSSPPPNSTLPPRPKGEGLYNICMLQQPHAWHC